jgi:peptidoglycan hydrolase FlgJ
MDTTAALLPSPASVSLAPPLPLAAARTGDVAAAHKAAQNFESFFLQQSFESMFAGTGTDKMFGGGEGETVYRSFLLQEYAKVVAKNGGVGIADAVQREILRLQEGKK